MERPLADKRPIGPLAQFGNTGPTGGEDAPPGQISTCNLILKFTADVVGKNVATYTTPEKMNELTTMAAQSAGYVDSNVRVFKSDSPATGVDIIFLIKPGVGEMWNSISRSIDDFVQRANREPHLDVDSQPVPLCTNFEEVIRTTTSREP